MKRTLLLLAALLIVPAAQAQNGFINEIHYDNDGADAGEFVEVALLSSEIANIADYSLEFYNGSNNDLYNVQVLSGCTAGAADSGYTLYTCTVSGIQNGAPDGIALVNTASNSVIEFLSYEGTMTADADAGGVAGTAGASSTDIGVSEPGTTPIGQSLQRTSDGSSVTFVGPIAQTPGALNTGQASLPVELVAFSALALDRAVQLRWATASETNNAGFAVEMRAANGPFAEVGFVAGFGTTETEQSYAFTVEGLEPGRYTFRLRQVDFDGASEYSPEVEATVGLEGTHLFTAAYPNPARGAMMFSLGVAAQQEVTVSAYDVLGREVATLFAGTLQEGQSTVLTLDGSDLPAGTYLVRAQGERFTATQRVTVLR